MGPVDVVLDTVGGDTTSRSVPIIRSGGLLISLRTDISPSLASLAMVYGVRLVRFQVASRPDDLQQVAARLAAGKLYVHLARTWLFARLPDALRQVASNHVRGKVSVTLG